MAGCLVSCTMLGHGNGNCKKPSSMQSRLKCEFHKILLHYLGYWLSNEGMEIDPSKVKAILEWEPPWTRRQLISWGLRTFTAN